MTDYEALKKVSKILDDNYCLGVGEASDNLGNVLSSAYNIIDEQKRKHYKKKSQKEANILIKEYQEVRKLYPALLNNFGKSKHFDKEFINILQYSKELSNLPTYHNPELVKRVVLEIKGFLILNAGLRDSKN